MSTVKNRIPQEEIDRANGVNLPRFLMSRGIELKRVGREYTMPEHDSLRIYDNQPGESGKWFRFSEGKGGGNIDFCEKFLGMDFRESVQSLNGDRIENLNFASEKAAKKPIEKREINIIKNGDMKRSFAYLSKTRGLKYDMIRDLAKQGKIVQEAGTGNVVFLINDENNKLVGAEKVGTSTEKRFKGISADSNPEYGFEIVKGKGEKALFFESAIDMLSYVQLHEKELDNHRLVSMTGLKDVTVEATVKRNGIAPENVYICSDNDAAGNKFAVKMREKYPQIKRITAGPQFKDWNDQLRGITAKIENIPRQQDISNNNADPSAQRGEKRLIMNNINESADKTFAYKTPSKSGSFTVVALDISTEERKAAVSNALKNIIDNVYNKKNRYGEIDPSSQPYRNLLEDVRLKTDYLETCQGHLECLKFALRYAVTDYELCGQMLDSIRDVENNPSRGVDIKGTLCRVVDEWKDEPAGTSYIIGQNEQDKSFFYARATNGDVTREYEYDYKPEREKVVSDHYDKLAEEDIDRSEAIYGADGSLMFGNMVEHIPQQQDISHNNNAFLSAQRGERKNTMNTKFEVSSMTMMDDPKVKAIASVAVNNELIVSGITVRENQKGELYVKMPQQKNGRDEQGKDKYEDRVFPTTAEARKALDEAVLGAYENLASQGLENSYVKIEPPEKSASKLSVSLIKTDSEKSSLKAKGQITIDNCFVIKDVKVSEHTNSKTGKKFNSVDLPHFKQNQNGEYPLVVKPITADIRGKINEAVMTSFNAQTRGVKFSELGGKENVDTYFRQNNQFAEKLMNKLEEKGIPYHAKIADTTTISVNKSDKAAVENIKKEITAEARKPSVLGEVNKIKAEQKAKEAENPTQQKAKSNAQER